MKIIATTERLYIREIEEGDQDLVYALSQESSVLSGVQQDEEYVELYKKFNWEEATKPTIYNGMVFLKDTDEFVGKICMQYIDRPTPELGIDIMKAYHNNGYAPESIRAFCNYYFNSRGVAEIMVRISKENNHSMHVFEKLGAEYVRSTSFVSENSLDMMQQLLPDADLTELSQNSVKEYLLRLPLDRSEMKLV